MRVALSTPTSGTKLFGSFLFNCYYLHKCTSACPLPHLKCSVKDFRCGPSIILSHMICMMYLNKKQEPHVQYRGRDMK